MKILICFFALLFTSSHIAFSQCKGFDTKIDEFKGTIEMSTLWIANSIKLRGNKMQYRVYKELDTTVFIIKTLLSQEISIIKGDEIIFINDNGDKLVFESIEDITPKKVTTTYGTGYELKAKYYLPDSMLKIWNPSFTKCRIYSDGESINNGESLTYTFDHKKNLRLFHTALNCYKREYSKIKGL